MERVIDSAIALKEKFDNLFDFNKVHKNPGLTQLSCFQFSLSLFTEEVPDSAVESMRGCGQVGWNDCIQACVLTLTF
jgi:hypothetical protein